VLSGNPRGLRVAGVLAAGVAAVSMGAVACTSVTGGDATVNAGEAPAYRTSVSLSSSQSAASSSARESQRQASMTTQAVHDTCETLSTTSADAIDAVNAYVSAYNEEGGDVAATEGPAVDGLNQSAEAVEASINDIVPEEIKKAFMAWVDGARATAEAILGKASPSEFNKVVGDLNISRSEALELCDATY
jgi:acyl-CoA hydrolase